MKASDASEEAWLVTSTWDSMEKTRFRRQHALTHWVAREAGVHLVSDAVAAALPDYDSEAPPCWEQDNPFTEISFSVSARLFVDKALLACRATHRSPRYTILDDVWHRQCTAYQDKWLSESLPACKDLTSVREPVETVSNLSRTFP